LNAASGLAHARYDRDMPMRLKIVEIQAHLNPFEDVFRKVKIFKDRAREESRNDAELRESRLVRGAADILDPEPK
jgi:hypothetical protein